VTTQQNKGLFAILGFLTVCLAVNFLSTSLQGSEKRYEIRPEVTLPESKTDIDRVIDAYERLMDNYLQSMDRHLAGIYLNTEHAAQTMESIDQKLSTLSVQLETIQKNLGIDIPEKPLLEPDKSGIDSRETLTD
jgi:hypothetical protein